MGGIVGLTKSIAELTLMTAVLDGLKNDKQIVEFLSDVDRIFKISGRAQLSPLFVKEVYDKDHVQDKCVFKVKQKSWIDNAQEVIGTEYLYQSRLWSFPANQLDMIMECFENMIKDVMETSTKQYIDVEHLLYKHIGPERSVELEYLHLHCATAPQAALIYD